MKFDQVLKYIQGVKDDKFLFRSKDNKFAFKKHGKKK